MTNPSTKSAAPPGPVYDEALIKRKLGAAIGLLAIFCVTYFTAAVIATRDFRAIAGSMPPRWCSSSAWW